MAGDNCKKDDENEKVTDEEEKEEKEEEDDEEAEEEAEEEEMSNLKFNVTMASMNLRRTKQIGEDSVEDVNTFNDFRNLTISTNYDYYHEGVEKIEINAFNDMRSEFSLRTGHIFYGESSEEYVYLFMSLPRQLDFCATPPVIYVRPFNSFHLVAV